MFLMAIICSVDTIFCYWIGLGPDCQGSNRAWTGSAVHAIVISCWKIDYEYTWECEVDEPDPDGEHPPWGERGSVEGGEEDCQEHRLRGHGQAVCGPMQGW